jgi:hypothetical protein
MKKNIVFAVILAAWLAAMIGTVVIGTRALGLF